MNEKQGELEEKNTAANREIVRLRDELRKRELAVSEVRRTVDMLLAATALKYGCQVGEGARELVLRDVGPELLERWSIGLRIEEKSGDYIFTVRER